MNTKTCTGCRETFPATTEYFHKQKGGKFGINSKCKSCKNIAKKEWRKENPEKAKEYQTKWRKKNPEKAKEYQARRKENPEKAKEYQAKWRKENPEKVAKWRKENPEKVKEYNRAKRQNAPCLVYKIINTKTGWIYIGETKAGMMRWVEHKSHLKGQRHGNLQLQKDWNKYGVEAFSFETIEELPYDTSKDLLKEKEGKYIEQCLNEGKSLYNENLNGKRGEDNHKSKLTWPQVRAIRKEYADGGIAYKQLGEKYGVSKSSISKIIRNKTWKEA